MRPFSPTGSTVSIDVSATSQRVALPSCTAVRIMNNGTATAWINFGGSTVTAVTTSSVPVGPGATEVMSLPAALLGEALNVAAIAAGSTGRIYFTPGVGK